MFVAIFSSVKELKLDKATVCLKEYEKVTKLSRLYKKNLAVAQLSAALFRY